MRLPQHQRWHCCRLATRDCLHVAWMQHCLTTATSHDWHGMTLCGVHGDIVPDSCHSGRPWWIRRLASEAGRLGWLAAAPLLAKLWLREMWTSLLPKTSVTMLALRGCSSVMQVEALCSSWFVRIGKVLQLILEGHGREGPGDLSISTTFTPGLVVDSPERMDEDDALSRG